MLMTSLAYSAELNRPDNGSCGGSTARVATKKDFTGIQDDYAFFVAHSTEARVIRRWYRKLIESRGFGAGRLHLLDFGCAEGDLSRYLVENSFLRGRTHLSLVDIQPAMLEKAVAALDPWSTDGVEAASVVADPPSSPFDIIFANHVFFYVVDLPVQVGRMVRGLNAGGIFLSTLATAQNGLNQILVRGYQLEKEDYPLVTINNVVEAVKSLPVEYRIHPVKSQLRFPDTAENRDRINRFIFGKDYERLGPARLRKLHAPFRRGAEILIPLHDEILAVTKN